VSRPQALPVITATGLCVIALLIQIEQEATEKIAKLNARHVIAHRQRSVLGNTLKVTENKDALGDFAVFFNTLS
jgi:hypothetical protein